MNCLPSFVLFVTDTFITVLGAARFLDSFCIFLDATSVQTFHLLQICQGREITLLAKSLERYNFRHRLSHFGPFRTIFEQKFGTLC